VNTWVANGRTQHLAQLNASVVQLTQALEDERDLSAGYAANRAGNSAPVKAAQSATNTDAQAVENEATGVTTGAGYASGTVQNLNALLNSLSGLQSIRKSVSSTSFPAADVIRSYSTYIQAANAFSASAGNGANDISLQGNVIALGSLLRMENDLSVQRAILYSALSSASDQLAPTDLASLEQAQYQQAADRDAFNAATSQAEQQALDNTLSGTQADSASSQESIAKSLSQNNPSAPLSKFDATLTAQSWYGNMSYTIGKTRGFAGQLVSAVSSRANTLRSQATRNLLISALLALVLLLLVLLISTFVARSLTRPLRKLRRDALDVAGHRLPEMVRRLSQSEGADETVEIEPIGVTSTDEIGEVARAFDQVHREAVRLAADEAMLRGNLNAMFINLSRRSQSLIERQLSLIDSLEQSEQDPGRLSSLFRLDHLATRMRRNSENLLVLAGHDVSRRWSQPVPLVDVLRAAVSEIEQYERVVLNVQPGIVVVGQAVNDVVHLVAEIVENATTFSPEDTQVYVSGQPLTSGGVLLDITDNGVGISDQEMSHANWRLDNPPVVDVAVSRRMGLFVVGRLAARHGVRVRLRHAQAGGLTALIWLPDTVAAPEVAPPLGRLRRFEADDYGPMPSLSAPTQTAGAGPQATTAARIPRFSPMSPSAPMSPSFTPAASAGSAGPGIPGADTPNAGPLNAGPPDSVAPGAALPGAGLSGAGTPGPANPGTGPQPPVTPGSGLPAFGAPASGTPAAAAPGAGNPAAAAAGTGWSASEAVPKLPVRNTNGNANGNGTMTPANGTAGPANGSAGDATDQAIPRRLPPSSPPGEAIAGGPSRLPSFGGPPKVAPSGIGSQNVHGGDGPSAGDPAPAASGAPGNDGSAGLSSAGLGPVGLAGPGQGVASSGRVTVPPSATPDQRLPIFDSLESDWFRSSGKPLGPPRPAPASTGPQADQAAAPSSWVSPADEGWRAAEALAVPAAGDTTQAGLPKRVPRANLVPGSVGGGAGEAEAEAAPTRSADAIRNRMASFQRGVRDGRAAAPQTEEPEH
jgi:signal transduction histidine kinase